MAREPHDELSLPADVYSGRYFAASKAIGNRIRAVAASAFVRAAVATISVAFVGGVGAGFLGIADEVGPGDPTALIGIAGALFLLYVAVLTISFRRALEGPLGDAVDVAAWADQDTAREWAEITPGSALPRNPKQARAWLTTHPETADNRPQRLLASLMIGDLQGARDVHTRYPTATDFQRHQRAADGLVLDIVGGRTVSVTEIDAANAELSEDDRLHAIVCSSLTQMFAAVASSGEWLAALARPHPHLPELARDRGRRFAWQLLVAIWVLIPAIALAAAIEAWLLLAG